MSGFSGRGALLQDFDGGQGFAFQHFQKGAAACGDVAHVWSYAVFGDGRQRVAAAGNAESAAAGDGLGNAAGAVFKRGQLEHAHGAVPHNGAGGLELRGQFLCGLGANVQNQIVFAWFQPGRRR